MRASTVFALALALLVGLAAAATAKYAGLFASKTPAPVVVEKPAPVKVLVAKTNIFEDVTVTAAQVGLRDLTADEERTLSERLGGSHWKEKLMPPLVSAAHLRVAKTNIPADQILLRDHFTDQMLPEELSKRLEPNTRAVNVSLPKDKVAGGVLRPGEHVDVILTTKVTVGEREDLRTACIARGCKIVMKRNNMWAVMASDPDDKPLHFTLQANPYRAALIEYGQTHGQLSLQPAPAPTKAANGSFNDPTSPEYANEDQRVEKMTQGVLPVGDADLARIFAIVPPRPARPAVPPTTIYHLSGVHDAGRTTIPAPIGAAEPGGVINTSSAPTRKSDAPATNSVETTAPSDAPVASFKLPSATGAECKTCGKDKDGKNKTSK